jgi:hypothetical protein
MRTSSLRSCRPLTILTLLSVCGLLSPGCINGPSELGGDGERLTAAHSLRAVDSVAMLTHPGLRLMGVVSRNVNADGTAEQWQYRYVDSNLPTNSYWFHATSSGVKFDSIGATGLGSAVITQPWIDSDDALRMAELYNGGMQFREQNPQCTITASLGEPVVPHPQITWHIAYQSTVSDARLYLSVNAYAGPVVWD